MRESLLDIVTRLNDLNGEDLAAAVTQTDDVQWCLSELRDILGIIGDMSVDHLREMVQADREGRCMVLPCKLGEKVWCLYRECFTNDRSIVVGESTFSYGMIHDFGKTVFLTREEAEKSLKEMEK